MVIEVLSQKYECGCGKGINKLEAPNLLRNLNMIIEWSLCRWPKKLRPDWGYNQTSSDGSKILPGKDDYIEDKPDDPELKPGSCFMLDGQTIAVDGPESLVLVGSESGPMALTRIYNEIIKPEFELSFNSVCGDLDVDWYDKSEVDLSEYDGELKLPSCIYRVWKDRFATGRYQDPNVICTVSWSELPFDISIILQKYFVRYKTSEFEESDKDVLEELVKGVLWWFCMEYDRKVNPLDLKETVKQTILKQLG